jgi:hypothetical protein
MWLNVDGVSVLYAECSVVNLDKTAIQRQPPLPLPTFSLFTGQWLDFNQLADYYQKTAKQLAALVSSLDELVVQHCLN